MACCGNCGKIPPSNRLCKGGICKECRDNPLNMSVNVTSHAPAIASTYTQNIQSNQMSVTGSCQGGGNTVLSIPNMNQTSDVADIGDDSLPVNNPSFVQRFSVNPMNQYLVNSGILTNGMNNEFIQPQYVVSSKSQPSGNVVTTDDAYWAKLNSVLDAKVQKIETKFDTLVAGLNCEVKTLEAKCARYEEDITTLKSIVANQQKSITRSDSEERERNIIVRGLSEKDITDDGVTYADDINKVTALLGLIDTTLPYGYEIQRLGAVTPNSNSKYVRAIKINVLNKQNRDAILKKAKSLKDAREPWKRVYLNRDEHPVVVQENSRLRKKMNGLKKKEEYKGKNIKIEKGKLKVDGQIVDQNLFFS